jgi:AcrR family transcriptional regulator
MPGRSVTVSPQLGVDNELTVRVRCTDVPAAANPTGLTVERIVDAAIDLIREEGFVAVSMRRLADRLGVGAMTLYGYVSTKEEVLGAVADRFLSEVALPAGEALPWEEQVKEVLRSVRRVLTRHPELADIVARQHTNAIAAYRGAEVTLSALQRAGLSDEDAISAFIALLSFTVGFAQRQAQPAQRIERLAVIGELPPGDFPHVARVAELMVAPDSDRRFEDGLDLFIRGIASRAQS